MEDMTLMDQLHKKMEEEHIAFRREVEAGPPNQILDSALEYAAREDIMVAMEDIELEDGQIKALLGFEKPLESIYKWISPVPRDTLSFYREEISNFALKESVPPLYMNSRAYAAEHGELAMARASDNANMDCRIAIEDAVGRHYDYTRGRLNSRAAVGEVLEKFGPERTAYIVGLAIREKDGDARISRENREWAFELWHGYKGEGPNIQGIVIDKINIGLLDLFARELRRQLERTPKEQEQPAAQQKPVSAQERPSLNERLAGARQALGKAPVPAAQPRRERGEGR